MEDLLRQVMGSGSLSPTPFWGDIELQAWTPGPALHVAVCRCRWGVSGLSPQDCGLEEECSEFLKGLGGWRWQLDPVWSS